ncbi:hypothetical protein M427DRAFT_476291 [Gonapodya prolifera JEL478]|uniref:Uncharacterized protein n=1 Tax=Gonapodya prolifera (strain JEL478) TaxID=1344416 RepID=A0A139A1J4_GONPJ|nr:hypothetical protein M427DRAFT_476291 [Gonapodya prolifera JEL478]|eukprot:KXS10604.1 hypothetical protein M427DRAFT_476291 [Gonapodya prolifera JEL478]
MRSTGWLDGAKRGKEMDESVVRVVVLHILALDIASRCQAAHHPRGVYRTWDDRQPKLAAVLGIGLISITLSFGGDISRKTANVLRRQIPNKHSEIFEGYPVLRTLYQERLSG